MKSYTEVVAELDAPIPRHCVSLREGGSGRKLSYLEGHYVIDRLNKVVGAGNWAYTATANVVYSGAVPTRAGDVNAVSYIAQVRLVVTLGEKPTEFTDYGYGDGTDRTHPGKAHELAVKEAVTDGLKRCAKNLGMSMGLALYDKTQENVSDETEKNTQGPQAAGNGKAIIEEAKAVFPGSTELNEKESLLADISAASYMAQQKRIITREELIEKLKKDYKVSVKEDLSLGQAKKFLQELSDLIYQPKLM